MAKNDRSGRRIRKTGSYSHPSASALVRPEIATQAQFRKKKAAARYCYDSSLSPALDWDGQNPAREQGKDSLKRALRGEFEDSVWDHHLAGSVSTPFEAGKHGQIAVKVIDDRGNELIVVKALEDAS